MKRLVHSKQYIVDRKRIGFSIFVFSLFTVYGLLPTTVSAQSVDLLWQGDGYVPPFYSGRTLWIKQSAINLLALPQGLGDSKKLYFKWSRNGTVLGNTNGIGRNTLSFSDSILSKSQTFEVEIMSANEEELASASVSLTPVSPLALIYENNPLLGFMFHKEVGSTYQLNEKEVTFAAFPLFFGAMSRTDNPISYVWQTNDGEAGTGSAVTYRIPEDVSGTSKVSLKISNNDKITQEAAKNFLVQFGEQ